MKKRTVYWVPKLNIAVVLALVACGAVIVLMTSMIPGKEALNPLKVYAGIWDGAVGTSRRMWVTFREAAILLCVALAVLPAFRMRFWNIGAEGQVLMGALASAACMIRLPSWRISSLSRPTALVSWSLRRELEQTSSAKPAL